MSNFNYEPGVQNAPFGLPNANPQSSNYAAESAFNAQETNLLRKDIKEALWDTAPAQYNAMKLLFSMSPVQKNSDEFEYLEYTFGRNPLTTTTSPAAVPASPGNIVTQTVDVDNASLEKLSKGVTVLYPNNEEGVIQNVVGNTVTIGSLANVGLPAITAGDLLSVRGTIIGDGMDSFLQYQRTETITRYNYIQRFQRARRWDNWELKKFQNTGTTNFLEVDKKEVVDQLRIDMFNSFINGHRGEYVIDTVGTKAKSMDGIFPSMERAGSANATATMSTLQSTFQTLAFRTNYKAEGATRYIIGSDESIFAFSQIYKESLTRYAPNDTIANLNLSQIKLGSQNWVLMNCELFREQSCFPAVWAKRLLFLDLETIRPVMMKGTPQMNMGQTLSKKNQGTREDFTDFWAEAQLSLEMNNPLSSFWIDLQ